MICTHIVQSQSFCKSLGIWSCFTLLRPILRDAHPGLKTMRPHPGASSRGEDIVLGNLNRGSELKTIRQYQISCECGAYDQATDTKDLRRSSPWGPVAWSG